MSPSTTTTRAWITHFHRNKDTSLFLSLNHPSLAAFIPLFISSPLHNGSLDAAEEAVTMMLLLSLPSTTSCCYPPDTNCCSFF